MKSDIELQQDVIDELEWQPGLDAAAIGVSVDSGVVTLAGQVASLAQKWEAEHAPSTSPAPGRLPTTSRSTWAAARARMRTLHGQC